MNKEYIKYERRDKDAWVCVCGNTPTSDGFQPCDKAGNEMEPTIGSDWNDLYVCDRCGRIIRQKTLEVIGHRSQV
jgi:hypothetical protein